MTAVDELIRRVLVREGGIADVGDGMGVTRFGQTDGWLREFSLPAPLTPQAATENYLRWIDLTHLDLIATKADSLSDIILDIAVMSGHQVAIKALQTELHLVPDGILGPLTLGLLSRTDRGLLARAVIAWNMQYQGRIIAHNPDRAKFASGWANRLSEHVRRL